MGLLLLIFGVVLTLLGAGFVLGAHFSAKHQAGLEERCVVATQAELVGTTERSEEYMDRIEVTYHGTYVFLTEDGVRVSAENKSGYARPDEVPGPVVSILYNPNNPGEFMLQEEKEFVANSNILPGMRRAGIAMLVAGIPLLVAAVVFWKA